MYHFGLVRTFEGVLSNFDQEDTVCAAFLGLSKVFNIVFINILIRKLKRYGVKDNIFKVKI